MLRGTDLTASMSDAVRQREQTIREQPNRQRRWRERERGKKYILHACSGLDSSRRWGHEVTAHRLIRGRRWGALILFPSMHSLDFLRGPLNRHLCLFFLSSAIAIRWSTGSCYLISARTGCRLLLGATCICGGFPEKHHRPPALSHSQLLRSSTLYYLVSTFAQSKSTSQHSQPLQRWLPPALQTMREPTVISRCDWLGSG